MTIERVDIPIENQPSLPPMKGHFARPKGTGKQAAIIVAHELFGVNADIEGVVEHLADLGYLAIAPELYHRDVPAGTALERDEAGRKRGFELLHGLTREKVVGDVRSTMRYLAQRDDCDGRIGMLGFSMGGHIAYLAATQLDLFATAVIYGGWLTSKDIGLSQPEPTLTLTKGIADHHGRLLYVVGGNDFLVDAAQVKAIEDALTKARVEHEVLVQPGAEHAYFWEGTPAFHREARDATWKKMQAFFGGPTRKE